MVLSEKYGRVVECFDRLTPSIHVTHTVKRRLFQTTRKRFHTQKSYGMPDQLHDVFLIHQAQQLSLCLTQVAWQALSASTIVQSTGMITCSHGFLEEFQRDVR